MKENMLMLYTLYNILDEQNIVHTIEIISDNDNGTVEACIDGSKTPTTIAYDTIVELKARYDNDTNKYKYPHKNACTTVFVVQTICYILILIGGVELASKAFSNIFLRILFSGIFSLIFYFIYAFIYSYIKTINRYIKASKDPDVHTACSLGMSVASYRKCRRYYNEFQDILLEYGAESPEANKKLDEILSDININNWKEYQEYRKKETINKLYDSISKLQK